MNLEAKKTIYRMSFGIILYEILLAIILISLAEYIGYTKISMILGILVGTILLYISLIHMAYITSDVLASRDENYANKKTTLHAMIRKIILIIILGGLYFVESVNLLAVIFAMLGMKSGAYLVPIATKLFKKIKK